MEIYMPSKDYNINDHTGHNYNINDHTGQNNKTHTQLKEYKARMHEKYALPWHTQFFEKELEWPIVTEIMEVTSTPQNCKTLLPKGKCAIVGHSIISRLKDNFLSTNGRAYSSSLLHAIITHNHLSFLKIFSDFVHLCPNLQMCCPFLALFLKNHMNAFTF